MSDRLDRLHNDLSDILDEVKRYFTEEVKVTLCVRNPQFPSGSRDVVLTDDTKDEIIRALNILFEKKPN